MTTSAISTRNLTVKFGRYLALDDVSLEVPQGGCFGIVGESGSGKTTLSRVWLGLQAPESGEVRLFDHLMTASRADKLRRVKTMQAILQDPVASLSPRRRIGQLLDETGEVLAESRDACRARQAELIQRLGLPANVCDKYPYQISGGQARRVAVIRSLLMRPRVLIADEPTVGLDVSVRGDLLNLLQDIRAAADITIIVVSHDLPVIRLMCDDMVVMRRGKIVESGPAAAVFDTPGDDYTRSLLTAL